MFTKTRHLLLPLDFSERNDSALAAAHDLALESGCRVTLLHVVEPIGAGNDPELEAFTRRLTARADALLAEKAGLFRDVKAMVACENLVGRRTSTIVSLAAEKEVDLILLSSHRLSADNKDRDPFSISYQIALLAPCNVMLLKDLQ